MSPSDEILCSAQRLFARHGLKKVTTDDIAREAHVSKSTIYARYQNKQDILRAVVQMEMEELWHKIVDAVEEQPTVEAKLRAHLLTKIGSVRELINLHQITSESLAEHWEHAGRLRDEFVVREAAIIGEILATGVRREGLEIADIETTALLMAASLRSLEDPWAMAPLKLSLEEQVDAMLCIILNGLRPRPRSR